MNAVVIVGHIGKDGEMRQTKSGTTILSFSVATSERFYVNGQEQKKTEWHNCVAWRKIAESLAPLAKKGAAIMVVGKLETQSWEKDGKKQYKTQIVVEQGGVPAHVEDAGKPADDYEPGF